MPIAAQVARLVAAGEKLVKVVGEAPLVREIMNRHGVEIGGFAVHSSGKRVVVCASIDNLLKGAATQCLRKFSRPRQETYMG